jgi:hypothetical protein
LAAAACALSLLCLHAAAALLLLLQGYRLVLLL